MAKLDGKKYDELLQLRDEVEQKIKEFRPVRIKRKWKRCGKDECFCMDGPSDGSWGNLHGPYLFAQYVDHTTRKTKTVSLGRFWGEVDIKEAQDRILEWWAYYKVSPVDRSTMTDELQSDYSWGYTLRGDDFFNFYGLKVSEDTLDRHTRYYGTEASHDAFRSYQDEFVRNLEALDHEWASVHGLASHMGQRKLADLLAKKYYLVD